MPLRKRGTNVLLPLTFAVYLVTLLMLLSELDRQYYQREKESIIKYNFRELFPHETVRLQNLSGRILVRHEAGERVDGALEAAWREEARRMLEGPGCVFRIRIVPRDESALMVQQDRAKFAALNRWSNTLFYRNFQNVVSYEIAGAAGAPWIGLLSFHYTTPRGYAPIVALTNRYRLLALLVVTVVTAGYGLVVHKLILPVKRVLSHIDAAAGATPELMPTPSSLLEKGYNDLARDAVLLRVTESLRDAAAGDPGMNRSALLERIPPLVVDRLRYRGALLFDLSPDEAGKLEVSRCVRAADGAVDEADEAACRAHLLDPAHLAAMREGKAVPVGGARDCVFCDITQPDDSPQRSCLALFLPAGSRRADATAWDWQVETVARLAGHLREVVAVFDLNRRHVRNERSRANINLARNLGHDLTNIIATSKLDILTVSKILGADAAGGAAPDPRRELLNESMRGLLNNARLLQEVVNIYRSFSYINRPRFEAVRIDTLLDEIIDVFSLSLPSDTTLRRQYAPDLPACTVEPRLLKLAVFNVLTNAVDAIKRSGTAEGAITVATEEDAVRGGVRIAVRDNGPGILNAEGAAADQAEIDRVFRYGVSTKPEAGGEGLGLSWVWTIVEEFHEGGVQARNLPGGGAEFVMTIGRVAES